MTAHLDLVLLLVLLLALMAGYPVGLTLGGISVLFAGMGWMLGTFDFALFFALPSRLFGIMSNSVLLSVPMFVFMGLILERSRLAENMLDTAAQLFSPFSRRTDDISNAGRRTACGVYRDRRCQCRHAGSAGIAEPDPQWRVPTAGRGNGCCGGHAGTNHSAFHRFDRAG